MYLVNSYFSQVLRCDGEYCNKNEVLLSFNVLVRCGMSQYSSERCRAPKGAATVTASLSPSARSQVPITAINARCCVYERPATFLSPARITINSGWSKTRNKESFCLLLLTSTFVILWTRIERIFSGGWRRGSDDNPVLLVHEVLRPTAPAICEAFYTWKSWHRGCNGTVWNIRVIYCEKWSHTLDLNSPRGVFFRLGGEIFMVVDDTPRRVRRMFWTLELLMGLKCSVAFHQSPISKMVEGFNCTTFTTIQFKF